MYFSPSPKCKLIIPSVFKLVGIILTVQNETFWSVKAVGVNNYAQGTAAVRAFLGPLGCALTLLMRGNPSSEN